MFNQKKASAMIALVLVLTLVLSGTTFFKISKTDNNTEQKTNIAVLMMKKHTIEGAILDRYGNVIVQAEEVNVGGRLCDDEAYSSLIGINSQKYGTSGLRARYASYLYVQQKHSDRGATLNLTLDANLQEYTYKLLGKHTGSITVLNAKTGEVLALAARGDDTVGFNANRVLDDDKKEGVSDDIMPFYNQIEAFVYFNRATMAQDPPGSTFKVISAASLIENGMEDYPYYDTGHYTKGGNNIWNQNHAVYGETDLTKALNYSVNTYFASAGNALGAQKLQETAERFGFNDTIELDFATLESNFSVRGATDVKTVAQNAFGQGTLVVSPFQMAMVIGAVINDGTMMKPYLVSTITREDGKVLEKAKQSVLYKSIDITTATKLKEYLHTNAEHDLYRMGSENGYYAIAKTGTAETHDNRIHKYLVAGLETENGNQYAICMDYANLSSSDVDLKAPMRTLLEYLSVSSAID